MYASIKNASKSRWFRYASIVVIHVMLIAWAFPKMITDCKNAMFCICCDGIKNYFTLYSYVRTPVDIDGLLKYNMFAYPFGDYVYYTDNTPFFAIPLRWFCQNVSDISSLTIPLFNSFILLNLLWCGVLVYFIFCKLIGPNLFSYTLAIVLPWINFQVPRIWNGHFNLSYSSLILAAIALFLMWNNCQPKAWFKKILVLFLMQLLLIAAFMVHGYYIAIIGLFMSGLLFFSGIMGRKNGGWWSVLAAVVLPLIALITVLSIVTYTDAYYTLRKDGAMGYDHKDLKTNFLLLFTHYDFHSIGFPIASTMPRTIEGMHYLGNIGLFSFLAIWVGAVVNSKFRKTVWNIQHDFFANGIRKSLFWAGMLSLIVSFGEQYATNNDKIRLFFFAPWLSTEANFILMFVIASGAILTLFYLLVKNNRIRIALSNTIASIKKQPVNSVKIIVIVGIMIFLFVGRYSATFPNLFNPMFYLHFLTHKVEQFRCLSRFSWPFFWTFNLWIVYTLYRLHSLAAPTVKRLVIVLFVAVGLLEVSDYLREIRLNANNVNLFSAAEISKFRPLKLDITQYQAILPLPFYVVGSEDYDHTIDDNDKWSLYTMQLSLWSRLPLMACKMSRTPPAFSIALLNMVSNDTIPSIIEKRLNPKPVLVAVDKALLNDRRQAEIVCGGRAITMGYYNKTVSFVDRHHLTPIDSLEGIYYYSWSP